MTELLFALLGIAAVPFAYVGGFLVTFAIYSVVTVVAFFVFFRFLPIFIPILFLLWVVS